MLRDPNYPKDAQEGSPATDRKARAIAGSILSTQETAARWLTRRFEALPPPARLVCLLLFCLVLGGASGWVLATALMPGPKPVPSLQQFIQDPPKAGAAPTPAARPRFPPAQHRLHQWPDTLEFSIKQHP